MEIIDSMQLVFVNALDDSQDAVLVAQRASRHGAPVGNAGEHAFHHDLVQQVLGGEHVPGVQVDLTTADVTAPGPLQVQLDIDGDLEW